VSVGLHVSPPAPPDVPNEPILRFSVEQYHEMIQAGILTDGHVELLEGWLVNKMSKNPPHTICTEILRDLLEKLTPDRWFVRCQEPITLGSSEPEPDLFIVRGSRNDYRERHPGPAEVALVVEVSDATLERDRTTKKRIYASAGIPCYWIVNLQEMCAEVYTDPSEDDFGKTVRVERDGTLSVTLDTKAVGQIAVMDLFA
jgi:Uma2 family endonuclease